MPLSSTASANAAQANQPSTTDGLQVPSPPEVGTQTTLFRAVIQLSLPNDLVRRVYSSVTDIDYLAKRLEERQMTRELDELRQLVSADTRGLSPRELVPRIEAITERCRELLGLVKPTGSIYDEDQAVLNYDFQVKRADVNRQADMILTAAVGKGQIHVGLEALLERLSKGEPEKPPGDLYQLLDERGHLAGVKHEDLVGGVSWITQELLSNLFRHNLLQLHGDEAKGAGTLLEKCLHYDTTTNGHPFPRAGSLEIEVQEWEGYGDVFVFTLKNWIPEPLESFERRVALARGAIRPEEHEQTFGFGSRILMTYLLASVVDFEDRQVAPQGGVYIDPSEPRNQIYWVPVEAFLSTRREQPGVPNVASIAPATE